MSGRPCEPSRFCCSSCSLSSRRVVLFLSLSLSPYLSLCLCLSLAFCLSLSFSPSLSPSDALTLEQRSNLLRTRTTAPLLTGPMDNHDDKDNNKSEGIALQVLRRRSSYSFSGLSICPNFREIQHCIQVIATSSLQCCFWKFGQS